MRSRAVILLLAGVFVLGAPENGKVEAGTARPTVAIEKISMDRKQGTVDLRLRICFSAGPRSVIAISERRTIAAVVKGRHVWQPQAELPRRIYSFSCRSDWQLNWLLAPGLRGPGTYSVTIRVRDAYGRWTAPVTFSVASK